MLTIQSTADRTKARYADVTRQSARRINEEFDDEDQWMAGIVNLIRSPLAMTAICAHRTIGVDLDTYDEAPADELAFVRETLGDEFHVAGGLSMVIDRE